MDEASWEYYDHLYDCFFRMVMHTHGGGSGSGSGLGVGTESIDERMQDFISS